MTDGIGRIFGGNSYGVGGYVPDYILTNKELDELENMLAAARQRSQKRGRKGGRQ